VQGVCTAVSSLVMALAQAFPNEYRGCVPRAISRLNKVRPPTVGQAGRTRRVDLTSRVQPVPGGSRFQLVGTAHAGDYDYNGVTNPWLQVKLLRLLQYYTYENEASHKSAIDRITQAVISKAAYGPDISKAINAANAVNATVIEAINLAIHVNPDSEVVQRYVGWRCHSRRAPPAGQ